MHVIVLTPSVKDLEIQTPCADLEGVDGAGGGLPLKIQIQSYFKNLHTKMTENSPWTPPSHPGQTIFIPRTLQPPNPPPSVEKHSGPSHAK